MMWLAIAWAVCGLVGVAIALFIAAVWWPRWRADRFDCAFWLAVAAGWAVIGAAHLAAAEWVAAGFGMGAEFLLMEGWHVVANV